MSRLISLALLLLSSSVCIAGDFVWQDISSYGDAEAYVEITFPVPGGRDEESDYKRDSQDGLTARGVAGPLSVGDWINYAMAHNIEANAFDAAQDKVSTSAFDEARVKARATDTAYANLHGLGRTLSTARPNVAGGYQLQSALRLSSVFPIGSGAGLDECVGYSSSSLSWFQANYRRATNQWELTWRLRSANGTFSQGSLSYPGTQVFDITGHAFETRTDASDFDVETMANTRHQVFLQSAGTRLRSGAVTAEVKLDR